MKKLKALFVVAISLFLVFFITQNSFSEEASLSIKPLVPLNKLLNPDGTVNLSTGFSGSLDVQGYNMVPAADGRPRFVSEESSKDESMGLLAPGDENWDDRFGLLGIDGAVYALAVIGTDLYVGGAFTTAGGVSANY